MPRLILSQACIPCRSVALCLMAILVGLVHPLEAAPRLTWMIGTNAAPGASGAAVHGEFSTENGTNDPPPGVVTRIPGDPEYVTPGNPTADDDFHFAGTYPAGFNQLSAARSVPFDEPSSAWERALTQRDRTNRIHVTLESGQISGTNLITLRAEFASGGFSVGGVVQTGFGSHDIVVRFRNGNGVATEVFSGTLTAAGDVVANFTPNQVQATVGANTLEMVRTGPAVSGNSYWILYDYVLLTTPVQPDPNTPPVAPLVPDQHLPENGVLALNLNGPRMDSPGLLLYSLGDSITDGSSAFPPETYAWNALVSAARGWPLTNLAYGSATISDINWQLMPGFLRTNSRFHGGLPVQSPATVRTNHVTMMLTGYNDGRDGFGRTNQTAYQAFYRSGLRHAAAFMSIPTSGKSHAQGGVAAGSWSPSAIFGGAMGRTATADGSTLTFSNLAGRAIYIGYLASASNNMGSFAVTVDGQAAGVVSCTGAFGNRSARSGNTNTPIPPNVGLLGDSRIFESPLLFRVGGLADGPHTVTVTATASAFPVTILWAAGAASARTGLTPASGPSVWIGGTLRSTASGYINGSDAGMAVFTQIQAEVAAELAADGLHVQHVRAGDYFDPLTAMGLDTVHPSNLGHAQIATAFLEKLVAPASDAETAPPGLIFQLLSGPPGMTVSPAGLLAWTPTEAQGPAAESVQVRVTDAGSPALSRSNSFAVHVSEVNSRPVSASLADGTVDEGVPIVLPIPVSDADLPANSLNFALIQGPAGATLDASGVLRWTPDETQGGTSNAFQVLISDSGAPPLSVTNQFVRHVLEVNLPPMPIPVSPIALAPGESLNVTTGATDADLPAQTLVFERIDGPDGLTVSASGEVSWAPTPLQTPSAHEVRIRITDNGAPPLSATNIFQVAVVVPNAPPIPAAVPPQSLEELQPWQRQLTAADSTPPAGQLVWSLVSGPSGLTLSASGLLDWTPSEAQGPTNTVVQFLVTDTGTPPLSASGEVSLTVNEVNSAPVPGSRNPDAIVPPGTLSFQVSALDGDLPAQTLTFELISGPGGMTITTGGVLHWNVPELEPASTNQVHVRISDSGQPPLAATNVLTVVVTAFNSPPTTTPVSPTSVVELQPFELTLAAEDAQTPGPQLIWTLLSGPSGLSLSASGQVQWTPSEAQAPSNHPVRVLITDTGSPPLGVTNEFLLMALETNSAPVMSEVPGGTVSLGGTYQHPLVAADPDLPANALTFSLTSGPAGFSVSPSGLMHWAPGTGFPPGSQTVTVTVTDNGIPPLSHS
ncbi:MAG: hypothetical protein J0L84_08430, partial [Verrucomicrobia bacterium]|nr:hypothetical protein [Verrucomicrobiota bacterium]